MNPIPVLTDEQRAANLKRANEAREQRRRLRHLLATGGMTVGDVLASSDGQCVRMPVRYLIESLPGIGRVRSLAVMEELGIGERKRVGGLGRRQREALAEWAEPL